MKNSEQSILKRFLKRKKKITEALVVTFLITGGFVGGEVEGALVGNCAIVAGTNNLLCDATGRILVDAPYDNVSIMVPVGQSILTSGSTAAINVSGNISDTLYIKNEGSVKTTGGQSSSTAEQGFAVEISTGVNDSLNKVNIVNEASGYIYGGRTAILIDGGFQTNKIGDMSISNAGSIISSYRNAVYVKGTSGTTNFDLYNSSTGLIHATGSSGTGSDGIKVYTPNNSSGKVSVVNHGKIYGNRGLILGARASGEVWNGQIYMQNTGMIDGPKTSMRLTMSDNQETGYVKIVNSGTITGGTLTTTTNSNKGGGALTVYNTGTINTAMSLGDSGDVLIKSTGEINGRVAFDVGHGVSDSSSLSTLVEIDNINGALVDNASSSKNRNSNVFIKGSTTGNISLNGGDDTLTFQDNNATTITINGVSDTGSNRVTNLGTGVFNGGDGADTLIFDGFGHAVSNSLTNWEKIVVKNTDTSALTVGGVESNGLELNTPLSGVNLTIDSLGKVFIDTATTITNGTLTLSDTEATGAGTLVVDAGAIGSGDAITVTDTSLSGNLNIINFGGTGGFSTASSVINAETLSIIQATNDITTSFDSVLVNGEVLNVDGTDYLVGGPKIVGGNNYRVGISLAWTTADDEAHGDFTLAADKTFELDIDALSDQTGTFASGWDGKSLTKKGAGTLLISSAQSFTGVTTVEGGKLSLTTDNAIKTSSSVAANGTIDMFMTTQTLKNLSGANTGSIINNGTLTITNTADTTFAGVVSGSGTLDKIGANNLTLTGKNTIAGATTITAGTLTLGGTTGDALSSSVIDIKTGAKLAAVTDQKVQSVGGVGGISLIDDATLTITDGAGKTISGTITNGGTGTKGSLVLESGELTLADTNNSHYKTTVNSNGTVKITGVNSLGTNASVDGNLKIDVGVNGSNIKTNIGGSGQVTVLEGREIGFTGDNSNFTGTWNAIGRFNVNENHDLGLGSPDEPGILVNNKIIGSGEIVFNTRNENNLLSFGEKVGSDFSGEVTLIETNLTIDDNAAKFFNGETAGDTTVATLTLESTSTISIDKAQTIGDLNLGGGKLVFTDKASGDAVLTGRYIDLGIGSTITVSGERIASGGLATGLNLLDLDTAKAETVIVEGTTITGSLSNTTVTVENGTVGNFTTTEVGKYYFEGVNDTALKSNKIYIGTGNLSKVDVTTGKTLALDTTGATNKEFSAQITGAGNISTSGDMSLSDTTNSFTGSTTISNGELTLGGAGVLGTTSDLILNARGTLVLNGNDLSVGSLNGSGSVTLGEKTLTIVNANGAGGSNFTGKLTGGTNSKLTITGETITLGGASTGFTGSTTLDSNTTLTLTNTNGLGTSSIDNGGSVIVDASGNFANNLTGGGSVTIDAKDAAANDIAVDLNGDNSNFAGNWVIDGSTTITDQKSLGAADKVENAITGTGTLNVNLDLNGKLTLGEGVGEAFGGMMAIKGGELVLDSSAAKFLKGATLSLDKGGVVGLTSTQTIGKLILNGGNLDFTANPSDDAILKAGVVELASGTTTTITATGARIATGALEISNLLDLDTGVGKSTLVNGDSIIGDGALTLVTVDGTTGNVESNDIGSYYFGVSGELKTDANGDIYTTTGSLEKISVNKDRTLVFRTTDATDSTFSAQIVGAGNISTSGDITLSKTTNNFTGSTTVSTGTLTLGGAGVLGATSDLILSDNTTLAMNGNDLTVGSLNGSGSVTLGEKTLTIANANGTGNSSFTGKLTGGTNSKLTITGETITLGGASTDFAGATTLDKDTKLTLTDVAGLGTSSIANAGSITVDASGDLANKITGSGSIIIDSKDATNKDIAVNLTGDNSGFTGSWNIAGKTTITEQTNLGAADAIANVITGSGILNVDLTNATDTFTLGSTVGTGFDGTLSMSGGSLVLDTNVANFLKGATLGLASGGAAGLTSTQTIGNLTMNGGNLDFTTDDSASAILNAGAINLVADTETTLTATGERIATGALNSDNLLDLDTGVGKSVLVDGASITGTGTLDLVTVGNLAENIETNTIGSYYFGKSGEIQTAGGDIFVETGALTRVDVKENQTLAFTKTTDSDSEFSAQITGAGNISTSGDITLSDGTNSFTGSTTVSTGTLTLGGAGVLGTTSDLILDSTTAILDMNKNDLTVGSLNGTGSVTLGEKALTIANVNGAGDSNFTGKLTGGTNSKLTITGETITLGGASTGFTGATTLDKDTKLTLTDVAGLGTSTIANAGSITVAADVDGSLVNTITGAGSISILADSDESINSTVTITGDNSGFEGSWNIEGKTTITEQTNLGKADAIANTITGSGILNVGLTNATDTFTLGSTVGNGFTGTLSMSGGSLVLDTNAANFLVGATLDLASGGVAGLTSTQTIGSFTMNGGNLDFTTDASASAILNAGVINLVDSTTTTITATEERIATGALSEGNLLDLDKAGEKSLLIDGSSINGLGKLTLVTDADGTPNIEENTIGKYYFGASEGLTIDTETGGISAVAGALTRVDVKENQTLAFTKTTDSDSEFSAQITGAGNISTSGDITLSETTNSFTGSTTISTGTLTLGGAGVLGATSDLILNAGGTLAMNGNDLTVGSLNGTGSIAIAKGNTLTIANGTDGNNSIFTGTLSGDGSLAITGETISLGGETTDFSGATTLDENTKLTLTSVSGLGTSTIANAGSITVAADVDGSLANVITGAGSISILADSNESINSTVTITGDNSGFTGSWNIDGKTTITSQTNLGKADAIANVITGSGILNVALTNTTDTFTLGSTVGKDFTGTLSMSGGSLVLDTNAANFLKGATLDLASGGEAGLTSNQTIGSFMMNGGNLDFTTDDSASAILSAGAITLVDNTETTLTATGERIATGALASDNLLDLDTGVGKSILVEGASITGTGTLDLVTVGNLAENIETNTIGSYYFGKSGEIQTAGGDIFVETGALTRVDVNSGQTLAFDTTGADNSEFSAQITGAGNISTSGDITLSKSTNSFTGSTTVSTGTLTLGGAGVLGSTSDLILNADGILAMNGNDLTVGSLNGTGSISIADGRTLSITNGEGGSTSDFTGTLSGAGSLAITGETISLGGETTDFSGATTLDKDTKLTLTSVSGLGTSTIANAGSITVAADVDGSLVNAITGVGSISILADSDESINSTVTITGDNSGFEGSWNIEGKTTITEQTNLGAADAIANVITGSGILNVGLTNATDTFTLGNTVGNGFTGTLSMSGGSLVLDTNAANFLKGATLDLASGGVAGLTSTQTIGSFSMNGGNLDFTTDASASAILKAGAINLVADTETTLTATGERIATGALNSDNLLDLDTGVGKSVLVDGETITGTGTLDLVTVSDTAENIEKNTIGSYYFGKSGVIQTDANGDIFTNTGSLTRVDVNSGQTLAFDTIGADNSTFSAQITGAGNISTSGDITLSDGTNSFTGSTTVSTGTLTLGGAGVLGTTSDLILDSTTAILDMNKNDLTVGSLNGTGSVTLGEKALTIANVNGAGDSNFTGKLTGGTNSKLTITGETITLGGASTGFTGATTLDKDTKLTLTDVAGLGTSSIANAGSITVAAGGDLVNTISGAGSITIDAKDTEGKDIAVNLTGNNSGFAGSWNIAGKATITEQTNLGAADAITNAITGSGILNVGLTGTDTFTLGDTVGTGFTGTLSMSGGSLVLDTNAANFLKGATLDLASGGVAGLTSTQRIGNLTMNGGELDFTTDTNNSAILNAGVINLVDSTTTKITVDGSRIASGALTSGNLLDLDTGEGKSILVNGESIEGTGSLDLVTEGSTTGNIETNDIGSYYFGASGEVKIDTDEGDIFTNTGALTRVDVKENQTLAFTKTTDSDSEFSAQITGTGNISTSGNITLSETTNSFTGSTTIATGTLTLGGAGVLGATSDLILNAGGTLAMNGNDLIVGSLNGTGSISIADGRTLSITNGEGGNTSDFTGTLSGTGSLAIIGETISLGGETTDFSGATTLDKETKLTLTSVSGLGTSTIANAGSITVAADVDGSLVNDITGAGSISILADSDENINSTVTITGDNSGFTGSWNMAGKTTITEQTNLGAADAIANVITGSGILNVDLTNATDTFTLGSTVGTGFAGTLSMSGGRLVLDTNAASFLEGATLDLASGGVAGLTSTQTIGSFSMNGGNLDFTTDASASAILKAGAINLVADTETTLTATGERIATGALASDNLLDLDTGVGKSVLVDGETITGTGTLDLVTVSDTAENIEKNTIGSYYFGKSGVIQTDANGDIFTNTGSLTRVDVNSGQTLAFDTIGADNSTFSAQITGAGNISTSGDITLSDGTNSFTGSTTVSTGTLTLGGAGVLGTTSDLILDSTTAILDMNKNDLTVGSLNGSGSIAIAKDNTLSIANGEDGNNSIFTGKLSGTGSLTITGETISLGGETTDFSGATTLDKDTKLTLISVSGLGTSTIANAGSITVTAGGDLVNTISGAGSITIDAKDAANKDIAVDLKGANSDFTGKWIIDGALTVDNQADLGAAGVDANNVGLAIVNEIAGSGSLTVNLTGEDKLLTLGSTAGSGFDGELIIKNGEIVLDANGANFLNDIAEGDTTNVTLTLGSTSGARINSSQEIGDLNLSTSTLDFTHDTNDNAVLTAGAIALDGVNTIKVSGSRIAAGALSDTTINLLNRDAAKGRTTLVTGTSLTGTIANINLETIGVTEGEPQGNFTLNDIGTYFFNDATGATVENNSIYANVGALIQVDVTAEKTLVFDTAGAKDDDTDFSAQITGLGNISTSGDMSLSDTTNSFTGSTTVSTGTLTMGGAGVLGSTSDLILSDNTTLAMNGNDLTVGSLNGSGSVTLGEKTLTIANANGAGNSNFTGKLTGGDNSKLTLTGETISLGGASTDFTGATTLDSNTTLTLTDVAGLGTSTIANAGSITVEADGTLANAISGAGSVTISAKDAADKDIVVNLTGNNSEFTGAWLVDGSLNVSAENQLGGDADTTGMQVLNKISGSGSLAIDLSSIGEAGKGIDNVLTFAESAGSDLGGTLELKSTVIDIDANTATFLNSKATDDESIVSLKLDGGSTLNLEGNQTIGNLETASGTTIDITEGLRNNSILTVENLDLADGTIVKIDASRLGSGNSADGLGTNILDFDNGNQNEMIIGATGTVSNIGGNITLINKAGVTVGDEISRNFGEDTEGDAIAELTFTTGGAVLGEEGLGIGVELDRIEVQKEGVQLTLGNEGGDAKDNRLTAKVFGAGGIEIDAAKAVLGGVEVGKIVLDNGENAFTGKTTITSGTLELGAVGSLGSTSQVEISTGAKLDINSLDTTVGGLAGFGSVTLGEATLTIDETNTTNNFGGIISGNGGLTLAEGSKQILFAENTFVGATAIENTATLTLANDNAIAKSANITLAGNLEVGKTIQNFQNLSGADTGTLTLANGNVNLSNTEEQTFAGGVTGTGTLTLADGSLNLTGDNTNFTGTLAVAKVDKTDTTPGTAGILNVGTANSLGGGSLDIDGTLNVASAADFAVSNLVAGTGAINVSLDNREVAGDKVASELSFNDVGSTFTGNLTLSSGSMQLGTAYAGNTALLSDATLTLGESGMVSVRDTQTIGDLNISGGHITLDGRSELEVTNLNIDATGKLGIDRERITGHSTEAGVNGPGIGSNLLDIDDENGVSDFLVTTTGTIPLDEEGERITLVDNATGGGFSDAIPDILDQGNGRIGTFQMDYFGVVYTDAVTGEQGIGISYGLTEITIDEDKAVVFSDRAGAKDNKFEAIISGAGGVTVEAEGLTDNTLILSATNTFAGQTTITDGTLEIGALGAIGASSGVEIGEAGTLALETFDTEVKSLKGTGTVDLGEATLTVNTTSDSKFDGELTSSGNLTKSGDATLTLTAISDFTGSTVVEAGTLKLSNSQGNILAATKEIVIDNEGTIELDSSQTLRNVSGAGEVATNGHTLTLHSEKISDDFLGNTYFDGSVTGEGEVIKTGAATLIIRGDLGAGNFLTIDEGRVNLMVNDGAGKRIISNEKELELSFDNKGFASIVQGSGTTFTTGDNINITGDNSAFTGAWDISGSMIASENKHLGTADINLSEGLLTLQGTDRVIGNTFGGNGEVLLDLDNLNTTLSIANGKNGDKVFSGDMNISRGTLLLDSEGANTLKDAHTIVGETGRLTITDELTIGDLTLDGGRAHFTNDIGIVKDGTLNVANLDVSGGGILEIDTSEIELLTNGIDSSAPLLDADDNIQVELINSQSTVGSGHLDVIEFETGNHPRETFEVKNGSDTVATAILEITGVAKDGTVGVGFNLAELNIVDGETLDLNNIGAIDSELGAKLSGNGNITTTTVNANETIMLSNSNNSFKGTTTVMNGTLALGQDNSLGQTTELTLMPTTGLNMNGMVNERMITKFNVGSDARVDLNDGALSVGTMSLGSGSTLDFGDTGVLSVADGTTIIGDNRLSGSGEFNLTGTSQTIIAGNNTNSNLDVNIDEQAILMAEGVLGASIDNSGYVGFVNNARSSRAASKSMQVMGDFTNGGVLDLTSSSALTDVMRVDGDFISQTGSSILFDIDASTDGTGIHDRVEVGGNFGGSTQVGFVGNVSQIYDELANAAEGVQALGVNFDLITAGTMSAGVTVREVDQYAEQDNLARIEGSPFVWKVTTDVDSANLSVATTGDLGGGTGGGNGGGGIDNGGVIDLRPLPPKVEEIILGPEVEAFASLSGTSNLMVSDSVKGLHERLGELRTQKQSESGNEFLLRDINSGWSAWSKGTLSGVDVNGYYDGSLGGVDLGVDYQWNPLGDLDVITGAFAGYRHGSFDSDGSRSMGIEANTSTSTLNFGLYTTLFYKGSWYTDLVMQYGHIDSDITADQLTDSVHGDAFTGSVETGYTYQVTDNWLIEPQAQLTTTVIDLDDTTFNGSRADFDTESYVTGRLGARTEYELDLASNMKIKPYAKVSALYEFADREEVEYAGLEVEGHEFSAGMETGAGVTFQVEDYFSVYGEFDYTTDFDEFDQYRGSFGVRYSF